MAEIHAADSQITMRARATRSNGSEDEMEIRPRQPSTKGGADKFTGDVWFDVIAHGQAPSHVRVNVVRFAPGARTAWHEHTLGQTIHVTEGLGRVQARGGDLFTISPGDTIHTPPREWHGHGATPDRFMTHLAIWEVPADGPESDWGDQVTDQEYRAPATEPTR
jgi:quercetin dioxygenase-like cupin family protein